MASAIDSFLDTGEAPAASASPSGSQIDSFLDSSPQITGSARLPLMAASNAAKGLIESPSVFGLPFRLYDKYIGVPFDSAVRWATGEGPAAPGSIGAQGVFSSPQSPAYMATAQDFANLGKQAGIVDRPDLQPQTPGEKLLAGTAEGVGGAIPYAVTGGVAPVARAAASGLPTLPVAGGLPAAGRVLAQGAAGGFGATGLPMAWPDWLPGKQSVAPLAGAVIGALTGGGAYGAGSKAINAVANPSDVVQAYKDAGVTPRLAGDVTENPTLQRVQSFGAAAPGGAGRVQAAGKQAVQEFGNAVESTANQLGNSSTLQEAGTNLQQAGRDWLSDFRATSGLKWGGADQHFSAGERIPVSNYVDALSDAENTMAGAPATAKALTPALTGELTEALQSDVGTGSLQNATLPYQAVKGIRTRIGAMLSDPNLPADVDTATLKNIYGGLSDDLKTAAGAKSPDALADFLDASDYSRQGHDFIDGVLAPIVRKGVMPEQAASTALSMAPRGGSSLEALQANMPDATNELAAYKLRQMAQAKAGSLGEYSPTSFDTNVRALSPEAYDVLFGNNPAVASKLDALGTVAKTMKETAATANHSGTGPYLTIKQALSAPIDMAIGASAGHSAYGLPGAIAGGVGGAFGPFVPGYLAGQLTTRPWLTRLFAASPQQFSPAVKAMGLLAPTERPIEGLLGPQPGQP
jgi:hypothetical protein